MWATWEPHQTTPSWQRSSLRAGDLTASRSGSAIRMSARCGDPLPLSYSPGGGEAAAASASAAATSGPRSNTRAEPSQQAVARAGAEGEKAAQRAWRAPGEVERSYVCILACVWQCVGRCA